LSTIIGVIKSGSMGWEGHIASMGDVPNVYKILVGKPEENILLGRPRRRWEDSIGMDHTEIGWKVWIGCI